jgi:hypothetical protein
VYCKPRSVRTGCNRALEKSCRSSFILLVGVVSMRIITVEGFAGKRGGGYIYKGDAWMFRFAIASAEEFFRSELPHFIQTFDIDSRQIYELRFFGEPGRGLYYANLYVSFEPSEPQLEALQCVPSETEGERPGSGVDILRRTFMQVLRNAKPRDKKRMLEFLRTKGAKRQ